MSTATARQAAPLISTGELPSDHLRRASGPMTGFLLDTNVISEIIRPTPEPRVIAWMEAQNANALFLSAMTIGELERGVRRLVHGRRRARYERWIHEDLARAFEGRVLAFDREAALIWGGIMGDADRRGRPRPAADAQIAAVACVRGLVLATRNARDFSGMGVELFDPWRE